MPSIILASGSPRRRELLTQMGLPFTVLSPDVDEYTEVAEPEAMVRLLSQRKAEAVARLHPEAVVIAADTMVCLDHRTILGKPVDATDARRMLALLSGRSHEVYTGFTVRQGDRSVTQSECSRVRIRSLSPQEISRYVATGEPLDKAGSYAIQGLGSLFVSGIDGDYYNVMGLPVCALGQVLAKFGITVL